MKVAIDRRKSYWIRVRERLKVALKRCRDAALYADKVPPTGSGELQSGGRDPSVVLNPGAILQFDAGFNLSGTVVQLRHGSSSRTGRHRHQHDGQQWRHPTQTSHGATTTGTVAGGPEDD